MERPRDVFANACAQIAARLSDAGFRFAKSGPHATRKSGDFTFKVAFQSSHRNAAGAIVKLWIDGKVFSKKIEAWRKNYPLLDGADYVAGCQVGNLTDQTIFNDWNLADPASRPSAIENATQTVLSVALPYFSQFEDLDGLIAKAQANDIPSMTIDRVVEFLICFANPLAAKNAAANFLERHPNFVSNYSRDFGRYAERGLGYRHASGYAAQLALASHLFGFGDLTKNVPARTLPVSGMHDKQKSDHA